MALIDVRPYFRTKLESLGFVEWRTEFNVENIPRTLLTKSYHIESGIIAPTASNHQVHKFNCPIVIRVFLKGYLDPASAIDDAYISAQSILSAILPPAQRLNATVNDVVPTSIAVNPLNDANDNSVILEIGFDAVTFIKY